MGIVYVAVADGSQREVALKVLVSNAEDEDEQQQRRFLREARALASVRHAHVVGCLDFGIADGQIFLAMELMDGGDLWQRVKRSGAMSEADAVRIVIEAAHGVHELHRLGLLHRDLKPSNVFLDREGRAKVADLGLARFQQEDEHLTASGAAIGTPAYLPPEQAIGDGALDQRADVYGLGATLFALVTAEPPFSGGGALNVLGQVLRDRVPDIRTIRPGLSAGLAQVVRKATARDPRERYLDAAAFAEALQSLGRPTPRHWRTPALIVVGVGLAIGGALRWHAEPIPSPAEIVDPPSVSGPAIAAAIPPSTPAPAKATAPPATTPAPAPMDAPPWAKAIGSDTFGEWGDLVVGNARQRFRWCPPGDYLRGSPEDEPLRSAIERRHRVHLTQGFWLADTEVTQALWAAPSGKPSAKVPALPVTAVSWHAAEAFAHALAKFAKAPVRLPTEAEWEYACRAGSDGAHAGDPGRMAWHRDVAGGAVHPVATREPNRWGLFDLHGNAWEWCADGYADFANDDLVDPLGVSDRKVLRGGSVAHSAAECRSALRDAAAPGLERRTNGLRLAIAAEGDRVRAAGRTSPH